MKATEALNSVGYMTVGEDWPDLLRDVYDTLRPESVLDIGCGPCRSMMYFQQHGVQRIAGIDGSAALLDNAQVQPFRKNIVLLDLEKSPCVMGEKFDLVWSYEVAEHIGNEENFLLTLTENAAKYIVLTAAPPSQGGTHHVNCQEQAHWIEKIEARGFEYQPKLVEAFRTGGWEKRGYMAVSGMVFKRISAPVHVADDLRIAAHFVCYKDKRATYEALKSFRQHYPEAPVHLISDAGDDFDEIAKHFRCDYYFERERSGNGKSTFLDTTSHIDLWLSRLQRTCQEVDADWVVILEDDVRTQSRIKWQPPAPMAGPCTMPFSSEAKSAIRARHPHIRIEGYSGCGGTIIHRQTFLGCVKNQPDWAEASKADGRLAHHSDAILTFLFLWNGAENRPWLDHSELSQQRGKFDAAFDHQYKEYYGKGWHDSWLDTGVPQPKERKRGLPMRFHLLGLAHLPARREFVSCAYTYKIIRLAKMLKMRGHEVIFYGVEGSVVECDDFVPVVPQNLWEALYGRQDWKKAANFVWDSNDAVHHSFNAKAIAEIKRRSEPKDFLLCTMGLNHKVVADACGLMAVESGIGYEGIFAKYKVFESYAWMHCMYGKHGTNDGHNYDAVIPNYYESKDFPLCQQKPEPYLLHCSRMIERKGLATSVAVSRALKVPLIVAGQGDLTPYITAQDTHVKHVGVVGGAEKMKLFSEAAALIQPTVYIGPFEGVVAEAQLCGVPVLTTDFGAFAETVEHGYTGFRCSTLRDYLQGWGQIVAGKLSPKYVQVRAQSLWDLEPVSKQYEAYFYRLLDLYDGGWYSL